MGRKPINQIGNVYGKWTVIQKALQKNSCGEVCWICRCECGTVRAVSGKLLRRGKSKSCGCNSKAVNIGDKFGLLTVIDSTNIVDNYGHKKYKCLCQCGNIVNIRGSNLIEGNNISCGCSKISRGELLIKQLLEKNNISFQMEYKVPELGRQRFDFAIFKDNTLIQLIEFDGIQHFQEWSLGHDTLAIRQERDKRKDEWAKNHKIPLIRIPYWKLDTLTINDLLLFF